MQPDPYFQQYAQPHAWPTPHHQYDGQYDGFYQGQYPGHDYAAGRTIPIALPLRRKRHGRLGAMAVLLTLLGLAAVVFGVMLGHAGPPQPTSDGNPDTVPTDAAPAMERSLPTRIVIPSIGVNAPIAPKGLDSAGQLQPPSLTEPQQAGWYQNGPTPGQLGPAVVEGHVDSYHGPAVFYRLGSIHRGAVVQVNRADGRTATFTVDAIQRASKDNFPTSKVYGDLRYPGLRIITCGGSFDKATRSYTDNTIVYAHLTDS